MTPPIKKARRTETDPAPQKAKPNISTRGGRVGTPSSAEARGPQPQPLKRPDLPGANTRT